MTSSRFYSSESLKPSRHSRGATWSLPKITLFTLLIGVGAIWSSYNSSFNFPAWNERLQVKMQSLRNLFFAMMYQLEWMLTPVMWGLAVTICSWAVLYLDSNVPGRDPRLPWSTRRARQRSDHTFHLQYALTLYIGVFVTAMMTYDKWQIVLA